MRKMISLLLLIATALPAHASLILAVPVGQENPETGEPLQLPENYGDVLRLVRTNYRHRLTRLNFPSVTTNRVWISRDPKVLIAGRSRRFLIDNRTTLAFKSPERAQVAKTLIEEQSQIVYLVYDANRARGLYHPSVSEDDLWLAIRNPQTPLSTHLIRLSDYLDAQTFCELNLAG